MKNMLKSHVVIVSALGLLASVASAQPVNAAGAAKAAVPAIPAVPAVPPAPSVSAGASAGIAANAAGSAATRAQAPGLPPAATSAAAQGRLGAGASASPAGLNANATTHAAAQGQANGLAVATVASDRTRATLRMDETVKAIHAAAFATRDALTAEVQARMDASAQLVAEFRLRAEAAGDKSRAAFAKAMKEVRAHEKEVRADLKAAAKAADEKWGPIQSELAKSYGAYAQAVADAEIAAQGTVDASSEPKS